MSFGFYVQRKRFCDYYIAISQDTDRCNAKLQKRPPP